MFIRLYALIYKELQHYFTTPLAYVFIAVFLGVCGALTFYAGGFFARNTADMLSLFAFFPWIYIFFLSAIGMRLWSEEFKFGTFELLFSLPLHPLDMVLGKYLAALLVVIIALLPTVMLWATISYLGNPDHQVVISGYIGAILIAAGYLSLASFASALSYNQVISFIISATLCLIFTVFGSSFVMGIFQQWVPLPILEVLRTFSFLTRFDMMMKGVIRLSDVFYILSIIAVFLGGTTILITNKKG